MNYFKEIIIFVRFVGMNLCSLDMGQQKKTQTTPANRWEMDFAKHVGILVMVMDREEDVMEKLLCPLKMAGLAANSGNTFYYSHECDRNKCAWWVEDDPGSETFHRPAIKGGCAIKILTRLALP